MHSRALGCACLQLKGPRRIAVVGLCACISWIFGYYHHNDLLCSLCTSESKFRSYSTADEIRVEARPNVTLPARKLPPCAAARMRIAKPKRHLLFLYRGQVQVRELHSQVLQLLFRFFYSYCDGIPVPSTWLASGCVSRSRTTCPLCIMVQLNGISAHRRCKA